MAMTAEQNKTIAGAWNDPNLSIDEKKRQMATYGVGITDVMNATGQDLNTVAGAFKGGGDWGGLHFNQDGSLYGTDWAGPVAAPAKTAVGPTSNVGVGPFAMVGGSAPTVVGPGPSNTTVGPGPSTGPVPSLYDRLNPATVTNQPNTTTGSSTTSSNTSNGIINSYIPSNVAAPQWSVTPQMTVQGQLGTVMDANSPLMQQAKTQGLQMANERGLLNSSIAQSAAQDSMYKAALPIASADASMYGKSASENAGNATQIAGANISANTSLANTASNNATTLATNTANNETSRANAKLQTDAAAALGVNEAQYKQLTQGSASAAQLMTNYQNNLAALLRDTSITDSNARETAIGRLTEATRAAIHIIGATAGDKDLAAYMDQLLPAKEGELLPASIKKW